MPIAGIGGWTRLAQRRGSDYLRWINQPSSVTATGIRRTLRWIDRRLHVVHDWDSVIAQPEVAIVGQAAAVWPGTGLPGEVATVQQTEQFLAAYERTAGHSWSDQHLRAAWAAGLWTRAFDAKKASLVGADPAAALTKAEAKERSRLAGL
jgi:hypothetical protein